MCRWTASPVGRFVTGIKCSTCLPQLVDNKQSYEEIPPVLVLSSFIPAPNQN
jgi:hypothetical protein